MLFYQLYTIHAYKNGQYIPCVFFLLPDKNKITYINIFQHLVNSCSHVGVDLKIVVLYLNYEIAVHEAVRSVWPDVIIKVCQFHLGQAWYRKIQNLGLSKEYKDPESDIGKWFKTFFGLSYLDHRHLFHSKNIFLNETISACDLDSSDVVDCFALDILPGAPDDEKAM